jgi:hypothetical protein
MPNQRSGQEEEAEGLVRRRKRTVWPGGEVEGLAVRRKKWRRR